jgi:stage II sporulation protein P
MEESTMKRSSFTLDLSKYRKMAQSAGFIGKTYLVLTACTFLIFLLVGVIGYGQQKWNATPSSSMKGLAASVSNGFFLDMLGLEVPHLSETKNAASAFSQENILGFVFRMLTDINPRDPKTLLAREVPGLSLDSSFLLRKPNGSGAIAGPVEYPPANPGTTGGKENLPGGDQPAAASAQASSPTPAPSPTPAATIGKPTTDGKKVVLIYHSHNRESWVPELGLSSKEANLAQDSKINITLVGKELADRLEDNGVGAAHYATDYAGTVDKYNWYYSYKYSNKTVKEAFAANSDIKFVFDLHRDDSSKEKSTLTVDGKSYAKVFLIIGQKNPQWQKNETFASKLQDKLEKKLPGISRGIWAKDAHDGNAEYNQSLSPNSVLIEVGGVYNTLEECKRTAALLADVIADMYWDAAKVDAPAASDGKRS